MARGQYVREAIEPADRHRSGFDSNPRSGQRSQSFGEGVIVRILDDPDFKRTLDAPG
jgi:hypothetical protein